MNRIKINWIPVTEKLPERKTGEDLKMYLVTIYDQFDDYDKYSVACGMYYESETGRWHDGEYDYVENEEDAYFRGKVIAYAEEIYEPYIPEEHWS